jgi:hypothetical protein
MMEWSEESQQVSGLGHPSYGHQIRQQEARVHNTDIIKQARVAAEQARIPSRRRSSISCWSRVIA